jgi:OOP family OmpA-OmpF porin
MKRFMKPFLLTSLVAIVACSSAPQVSEYPATADPNQEMAHVEEGLKEAQGRQVSILSPKNFESASDSLDKAKQARGRNKDQKDILHKTALAQAYLNKANETANMANQVIPGVIKERQDAITAQAPNYFSEKFESADADLKDITLDIESGKTSISDSKRSKLEARYNDLELQAIRQAKLGTARTNIEQAQKEGANKLVPQTVSWAEKKVNEDDAIITANRHDAAMVDKASAEANAAAGRLLSMVRQAKSSAQLTPEQLASRLETGQVAMGVEEAKVVKTNEELAKEKAALENQKSDTALLAADNIKLEEKAKLEQQYEYARKQFNAEEAEVYKQGDKLVLRLKGLSFPKDQSVITTNNYPLLTKVQKVIKATAPESIVIEGHTDSTGSKAKNEKLSSARADAVEGYLKANNFVEGTKISAAGFGDSKPIASNKTNTGRAQNRRVDVILQSTANQ